MSSSASPARPVQPAPLWARLTATFFGIGNLRPGPGTWASVATVVLWALLGSQLPPDWAIPAAIVIAFSAVAIGIPAASRLCMAEGSADPQKVVIDEVAGQMITLIAAPLHWKSLLAGLILFRACDILKPPPARQLEQLHGGAGVVFDDVAAGLYAFLILQVLLYFGLFR